MTTLLIKSLYLKLYEIVILQNSFANSFYNDFFLIMTTFSFLCFKSHKCETNFLNCFSFNFSFQESCDKGAQKRKSDDDHFRSDLKKVIFNLCKYHKKQHPYFKNDFGPFPSSPISKPLKLTITPSPPKPKMIPLKVLKTPKTPSKL